AGKGGAEVIHVKSTTYTPPEEGYPQDYFRSPIGIPIRLSGSFAEMRSNHFHSGLDIKTNARPGYRMYAAAEGYISRIKVSPGGFGKALYVTHPNGYTTVYAHLSTFNDEINAYVKELQYRKESFAVEAFPGPARFRVSKGEVIAYSGNSGSSGGPHLHFEIRDTESEWPINPLLFGLPVTDTISPTLYRVKVYALDEVSHATVRLSNGRSVRATLDSPATLSVRSNGARHTLSGVKSIQAHGAIGFGIEQKDFHEGSRSRLGAYVISLSANGTPIYTYTAETFGFPQTRYLNAHVDYAERQRNRRWVQRSFLLPGNRLPMYSNMTAHEDAYNGVLEVEAGTSHRMKYAVRDADGNESTLNFTVRGVEPAPRQASASAAAADIRFDRPYVFQKEGFSAWFPERTFYERTELTYRVRGRAAGGYSARHELHNDETPVHKPYTLSIATDAPEALRDHLVIVKQNEKGNISSVGGTFKDGVVETRTRTLGTFYVAADTEPPSVRALNLKNGGRVSGSIRVRIDDDLSGIDSYAGYIDGEWVLFDYDRKRRLLEHTIEPDLTAGRHQLRVVVTDNVGQTRELELSFVR
ncbi:MAG: M23 family metallopeptidase, partial [Bacteroidota bacterium]